MEKVKLIRIYDHLYPHYLIETNIIVVENDWTEPIEELLVIPVGHLVHNFIIDEVTWIANEIHIRD